MTVTGMRALVIGVAVVLPLSSGEGGEKVRPVEAAGGLVLFDAGRREPGVINHYTARWQKGSDLVPVGRVVDRRGERYIEISYRGKTGSACSTIFFEKMPECGAGRRYAGLEVTIDCDRADYPHISVAARFLDNTQLTHDLTLDRGRHEYVITGGFRRAKFPPKWELLQWVWLSARAGGKGNDLVFRLRRITMRTEKEKVSTRDLEVGRVRKVREILPRTGPVTLDGRIAEKAWAGARRLEGFHRHRGGAVSRDESPFAVSLTYDDENLYVSGRSVFPTRPLARVTEPDGQVYQDEAQEYFFSAENDNDRKIQFVVNARGVVFDYVREYDLAAVGTRNKIDRSVQHRKAMRYDGETWTTEIAFPLGELKIDLGKRRYVGFQAAQSYHNRRDSRLRTVVWDRTGRFPDPKTFGVLVFNTRPFGTGEVEILGAQRIDRGGDVADFVFDCSFRGFAPGTYRARLSLVGGGTETVHEETISLSSRGQVKRTFSVRAPNRNGLYSLYLALANDRGDARLGAVNFDNPKRTADLFGQRLLTPEPKKVAWKEGAFRARAAASLFLKRDASERTRTTVRLFSDRFYGYTGRRLKAETLAGVLPAAGVVLRVATSAVVNGRREKLKPEGYHIAVEKRRVVITGADEPGLFYGTVTFFQLLTGSMRITDDMPVPCVEVLDWPDTPNRLVRLEHTHHFKNRTIRENRGIEYLMEWTDRFVAGNKLNVFFLDIAGLTRYERRPEFNGRERIYTLEDLRRYGRFCRDRFVDLCPAWQIGGHANWWLTIGYHPELREKGWRSQGDVTHPDHDPIVYDCMQDVIDALRPKYLSPKSDEWWHSRHADEAPDELLRGKTRARAFLDFHVKLNRWLKPRGIRMMIYHDMLTPYHNGKRFDVYKIIDEFPKDVIIQLWSGRNAEKDIRWFTDRGFDVWTNGTGFVSLTAKTRRLVTGYGKGLYSFGAYRRGLLDKFSSLSSMGSLIHSADYAWNLSRCEEMALDHARLVALRHMLAVRPNPHAGAEVTPIDITPRLTHSFKVFLKQVKPKDYARYDEPVELRVMTNQGAREIGFIPTRIGPENGKNCVALRKGDAEVAIPVGGRYSSLVFLQTAFVNNPKDPALAGAKVRRWMYGWPCGEYVVHWDDGTHAVLPLRLTLNVKRFDTSSLNRATNDNRYVRSLTDAGGNDVHLYQWEWVNPKPEREIVKVVCRHDDELDVSLVLFAVSGRAVR